MWQIVQSKTFLDWHHSLPDKAIRARINARLRRIELGNLGDWKYLCNGVSELRFDVGPGYRVYVARRQETLFVLLCGGTKSSQKADLAHAIRLVRTLKDS